jgi:hypothetical protein
MRGPRGPRGKIGPPGPKGERGEKGDRGPRGKRGFAAHIETASDVIRQLQHAIEHLRAESEIQLHRIADLQAQLDITLGEFRHLREREGEKV